MTYRWVQGLRIPEFRWFLERSSNILSPCSNYTAVVVVDFRNENYSCIIDWFWLPIFRTNLVRGLSNKEMSSVRRSAIELQNKWAKCSIMIYSTPQSKSVNCCPGVINFSRNSFRLRTSTPWTRKRAQYACWHAQEETQEIVKTDSCKQSRKPRPFSSYEKKSRESFFDLIKLKYDLNKGGKRSCWIMMFTMWSNQLLHERIILSECRLSALLYPPLNSPTHPCPPTPLRTNSLGLHRLPSTPTLSTSPSTFQIHPRAPLPGPNRFPPRRTFSYTTLEG